MNTIHISKFPYTSMINSKKKIQKVSVATDEGPKLKLALSKGGSRGNKKFNCECDSNSATAIT